MKEVFSDFVLNSSLRINLGKYLFIDQNRDTIHNIQQLFESDNYKLVLFLSDKQYVECQINAFKSISDRVDLSNTYIPVITTIYINSLDQYLHNTPKNDIKHS
ncbi:hypothetical protein J2T02_004700 [Chitinophaga terrae (ex Kim and Jung 2007)]|nr:hypothetical protein [Chitinophaga terrae (ex Kim and Jung 2007)]